MKLYARCAAFVRKLARQRCEIGPFTLTYGKHNVRTDLTHRRCTDFTADQWKKDFASRDKCWPCQAREVMGLVNKPPTRR
jgi:hypothetical protein